MDDVDLSNYMVGGVFRNEMPHDISLFLEPVCEEVVLSPGHEVEVLVGRGAKPMPIHVWYYEDGLRLFHDHIQDWLIRFNGQVIFPEFPTRLADFEDKVRGLKPE